MKLNYNLMYKLKKKHTNNNKIYYSKTVQNVMKKK